jgi:hypothetical protein
VVICYLTHPYNVQVTLGQGGYVMKRKSKLGLYIFLLLLVAWPVYQVYGAVQGFSERQDAGKLLYQVSFFQMELLGSFLQNIDKTKDTDGLNSLRQAIYTANFTHEHLVLAYGVKELTPLQSLPQLMQYVLRLQIGGQRALRPDEAQTLLEIRRLFSELYEAYGRLLSSSYKIIGSQNTVLIKADKAVLDLLHKKMQQ